jgi:predicted ATPase
MQAVAPVGSIAVSEATRRWCEGYFTFKSLGPTRLRGVQDPIEVHEVTGLGPLRTRLQRAVGRGLTKFIGREREMDTLRHAAQLVKQGKGQVVAVIADPGVGKSRLFYEFKATSQSAYLILEALSVSHGKATAYLPVLELLRDYFRILPEDDARTRREKVAGKIVILDYKLKDTMPYLYALLGIVEGDSPLAQMDPQIRGRRTRDAIKRILLRESLNQPLIVIFEDLHWIDIETQAFLSLLVDATPNARILLLVNYRPEYRHEWGGRTHYKQLRLDSLSRESAEQMLSALLGDAKDLMPVKRLIIERTEGIPFFMEEIVQSLFEQGALARNGTVKLTRPLTTITVPATVQAVLASRIDRLPSDKKDLLQKLAVIGREFTLPLVREIAGAAEEDVDRMLVDLQGGDFIHEQPAFPELEYVFKHALTQEVAYNSVLIERRKLLHERAGEALESIFAERLDDHLSELARHYKRADNIRKAIEYSRRAGQQAIQRCAHADAIDTLSEAISLAERLPDTPERVEHELSLQVTIGPALFAIKGWGSPESVQAYTRARELCEKLNDSPELFPTLFGMCFMRMLRGEFTTAYEVAQELMRRAETASDPAVLLYAHHALGQTLYFMGQLPAGQDHLERAVSLYDPAVHLALTSSYAGIDARVHCQGVAAWSLWHVGYPDQAMTMANQVLAWAQGLSHPYRLVFAEYIFSNLIEILAQRDLRAAQERSGTIIAMCEEYGLPDFAAFMSIEHGWAIAQQGRDEEGVTQIRDSMKTLRARGVELERPRDLCLLAEACRASGKLDDGLTALSEALVFCGERETRVYEAEVRRLKGELLLQQCGADASDAALLSVCD